MTKTLVLSMSLRLFACFWKILQFHVEWLNVDLADYKDYCKNRLMATIGLN